MRDVPMLVRATEAFIRTEVLSVDDEHDGDVELAGGDDLRLRLQTAARGAGLFAPHGPIDYGGLALKMSERAPVFEAAGHSLFGPMALNINAPDVGNIHLLDHIASEDQRARFLGPLVRGELRSAFAMTEPAPGAGSDPSALMTRASKVGTEWLTPALVRVLLGGGALDGFRHGARHGHVRELGFPAGGRLLPRRFDPP